MTSNASRPHVAYYRVSTAKQGASGLGLEAQREAVARYLRGDRTAREFTEVESGKNSARPVLAEALAYCRRHRAVLIIAKLDRLARNVHFISGLMEAGVDFVACDNPEANRLTLHILAAVAENEARAVSERTKAALQAAKARGVALGGDRGGLDRARAVQATARAAFLDRVRPVIAEIRQWSPGATSVDIAAALNARGVPARMGGTWHAKQVYRVMERDDADKS